MKTTLTEREIYLNLNKLSIENIKKLFDTIILNGYEVYKEDKSFLRNGKYFKNFGFLVYEADRWICTKVKHINLMEVDIDKFQELLIKWNNLNKKLPTCSKCNI